MPTSPDDRPFVLHLLRLDETSGGGFRPGAFVAFTPALRTSGLLLALSGEELKSLLLVLTFASANGHVQPSLVELSQALRQPHFQTRAQMRRLERFLWQGRPLLHELRRESGLHAYAPSPRILGIARGPQIAPPESDAPAQPAAGRAAIVAHSRAAYTSSRAEAERQVAQANGWEWPFRTLGERQDELRQKAQQAGAVPDTARTTQPSSDTVTQPPMKTMNTLSNVPLSPDDALRTDLRRDLSAWGVPSDLAERLLADHAPERIRQQLDWLPLRNAHDPARLLVAAIQRDYAPPASVLKRQALEQALHNLAEEAEKTPPRDISEVPTDLPLP